MADHTDQPALAVIGRGSVADGYAAALRANRFGRLAGQWSSEDIAGWPARTPVPGHGPDQPPDGYVVAVDPVKIHPVLQALPPGTPILLDPPWNVDQTLSAPDDIVGGSWIWPSTRHRHRPLPAGTAEVIRAGRIGEPVLVDLTIGVDVGIGSATGRTSVDDDLWVGLWQAVDLVTWWVAAAPRRVWAQRMVLTGESAGPSTTRGWRLGVEFTGGATAACRSVPSPSGPDSAEVLVVGTESILTTTSDGETPTVTNFSGTRRLPVAYHGYGSYLRQWWNAASADRRGGDPVRANTWAVVATMAAARRSLDSQQPEAVGENPAPTGLFVPDEPAPSGGRR